MGLIWTKLDYFKKLRIELVNKRKADRQMVVRHMNKRQGKSQVGLACQSCMFRSSNLNSAVVDYMALLQVLHKYLSLRCDRF